jgi:hypothetical protein
MVQHLLYKFKTLNSKTSTGEKKKKELQELFKD